MRPLPIQPGDRFGRLTVIGRSRRIGRRYWSCRCSCGTVRSVAAGALNNGRTRSCGCLSLQMTRARSTTHGGTARDEHRQVYLVWSAMRKRCNNPKDKAYERYGGRGITVCVRWEHFENFLADIGPRPSSEHSIDRKDNDGGYWCGKCAECARLGRTANCRWATRLEQNRNTRRNVRFSYNGEALTLGEWSERSGIHRATLRERIVRRGWNIEDALTRPAGPNGKTVYILFRGQRLPLVEWCQRMNMPRNLVALRLYQGWSAERALTEQVNK